MGTKVVSALGHVWTAPWQELFRRSSIGRVRSCVRPVCAAGLAAGHNAMRGSGPNRFHALHSAMTQTGSPDPQIDLVCITSSYPRQFLQLQTPLLLPGLTSLTRSRFTQPHYSTLDAAEWAPSTSSLADPKADICSALAHVRQVPIADIPPFK